METSQHVEAGKARQAKLTKEQKSALARSGAKAMWAKRKASEENMSNKSSIVSVNAPSRPAKARRRRAARRVPGADQETFMAALRAAEKRLPEAMKEQAEAASRYTILGAEIEYLRSLIRAMTQQAPVMPGYYMHQPPQVLPPAPVPPQPVSMAQIMSDMPLPPAAPPAPRQPVQPPVVEIPFTSNRAGGGALDTSLVSPVEDEDQHLKESAVGGGTWV